VPVISDGEGVVALGDLVVADRFAGRLSWDRPAA